MKETRSPLDNPTHKWIRGPTFYQHMRPSEGGIIVTIDRRRETTFWIADVKSFVLDNGLLSEDSRICCNTFRIFGGDPILINWGFPEDVEHGHAQWAVRFGEKWFLIEKNDEFTVDVDDSPPYNSATLVVSSGGIHKSVIIYKNSKSSR